jgi:NhaP-type Na+/H+ or K+/H+ antiporter
VLIVGLFLAGLLGYALVSSLLDRWSLTPHIVVLTLGLVAGLIVDPATLGFDAGLLHGAGEVALILALFVDAARIDVRALRGTAGLPVRLLAIGLPLTILAGLAAALLLLPGLTLTEAFLLAALVAPTDASLGAIVVSTRLVPLRVRQALNVESGLNDGLVTPIVVFAAAATVAGAETTGAGGMLGVAAEQVVRGVVAGLLVGAGGALAIRLADARHLILPAARWIAAPILALIAWFVAHELEGNAFVAAFVAGLAYAATIGRAQDEDLEIGEVGGELLALLTFFLFGVLVPTIGGFDVRVIVFAVVALTVVRLGPVAVALLGTGLSRASVLFMGWFGPRGLASIVLAIVAIGDERGAPSFAPIVVSAVAATVVLSVFAHGLSAGPAVRAHARAAGRLPPDSPEHGEAVEVRPRRGVGGVGRSDAPRWAPDATSAGGGGSGD